MTKTLENILEIFGEHFSEEEAQSVVEDSMKRIGESLEFKEILRLGLSRSYSTIHEIPIKYDDKDKEAALLAALKKSLHIDETDATLIMAGSLNLDSDVPEFAIILKNEGQLITQIYDESIKPHHIENVVDYLVIRGLQEHPHIKEVLHSDNCILPDGVKVLANGNACRVKVGDDGSYSVDTGMSERIKELIDRAVKKGTVH